MWSLNMVSHPFAGKSIRERALELIRVAHPKFRPELLAEVRKHYWVPNYQVMTPMEVPELGTVGLKILNIGGETFRSSAIKSS